MDAGGRTNQETESRKSDLAHRIRDEPMRDASALLNNEEGFKASGKSSFAYFSLKKSKSP